MLIRRAFEPRASSRTQNFDGVSPDFHAEWPERINNAADRKSSSMAARGSAITCPIELQGASEVAQMSTPEAASRKVLLVEDESLVAMMASDSLSELGFDVVEASSARAALDRIGAESAQFEFAMVDLGLPDRPGEELIAEIKMLRPDLPIIVASGYSEDVLRARIKADTGLAFLNKPYDLARLQSAIHTAIRALDRYLLREPGCTRPRVGCWRGKRPQKCCIPALIVPKMWAHVSPVNPCLPNCPPLRIPTTKACAAFSTWSKATIPRNCCAFANRSIPASI